MKKRSKQLPFLLATILIIAMCFSACGSSNPCEKCDGTPTKGYKNASTGEKDYYCAKCSSECMWCQDKKATKHYTNAIGTIMFVCDECYEDLHPSKD